MSNERATPSIFSLIGLSSGFAVSFLSFFLLAVFELSPTAIPFRLYQSMIWAVWKPRKGVPAFPDKVDATTAEGSSMSEAGNRTDPEPEAATSIFEPLLRIKGVVIASIVLAVCVLALDLPFWFRAGLLALVVL